VEFRLHPYQQYHRYCWVTFDSEENCEKAYESLNDYKISSDYKMSPIKSKSSTLKKIRVTPSLFEERIIEDLEFSKQLVTVLDKDKNIEHESNCLFDGSRSKEQQLDIQILYLRRVHGFCYYCLEEYDDERMLSTKCDNIHLRSYKSIGSRNNLIHDESNKIEIEWDKNFTRMVKIKIDKLTTSSKSVNYYLIILTRIVKFLKS
jgi:hypothetical protein